VVEVEDVVLLVVEVEEVVVEAEMWKWEEEEGVRGKWGLKRIKSKISLMNRKQEEG